MMRFRESWEIKRGKEWDAFEEALEYFEPRGLVDAVAQAIIKLSGGDELGLLISSIFVKTGYDGPYSELGIERGEEWDAYWVALDYLGDYGLVEALAQALGDNGLGEVLAYIFKRNKFYSAYLK